MPRKSPLSIFAALFLFMATAIVGTTSPAFAAKELLQGEVCEANVHKLTTEIDWYTNLKKAEKTAAEQNKLILWVHMVGKIDGAT
ncbi:MAG: hypothetical protein U0105_05610 [Candidatus Obscuribacterales bacterium]